MERAEKPRSKGSSEGTWKRDKCQKTNLWNIQVLFTNHLHKYTGESKICITDVTIMVAQYEKRHHIKSKGVMDTSEQGGSMLDNQS